MKGVASRKNQPWRAGQDAHHTHAKRGGPDKEKAQSCVHLPCFPRKGFAASHTTLSHSSFN